MPGNPFYKGGFWRALREQALKRDGFRCAVKGCFEPATIVDHIIARPRGLQWKTTFDKPENLRSLCKEHDNQGKEDANGERRMGGKMIVRGSDVRGMPVDPGHPWNLEGKKG